MFNQFKNLCSCHKNKIKDGDDDDLPYSPKKKSTFFSFKKNMVVDTNLLTSTPNQLVQVRKLSDDRHYAMMDAKNNNSISTMKTNSSINHQSINSNDNQEIFNSPIERDPNTQFKLDSNDELNNDFSMNRSPSINQNEQRSSFKDENHLQNTPIPEKSTDELNMMNDKFSKLWSSTDLSASSNNKLIKNDSTNDSTSNGDRLTSFNDKFRNHSSNNLNDDQSNQFSRPKNRNSFHDSTDNIHISNSPFAIKNLDHDLEAKKNIFENEDVLNLLNSNALKYSSSMASKLNDMNQLTKDADSNNSKENESKDNQMINDDLIGNLINVPTNITNLKCLSDDKMISDNSSIESVIIDKQSNEIMRKSTNQSNEDDQSQNKHPNSIIIQETLKLTLKRDKNDKKSLNEFSMDSLPKQIFEISSFVKEYFYDEPIIKTSSVFIEPDLATYRMQSNPRGVCLIINNATTNQDCLRLKNGFSKEVNYFKDLFNKLGFDVKIQNNINAVLILKLMKNLKNKIDFKDHDAFICIYFGHGNQNYVIGEDNYKLNLELMIGCLNNYHCPKLINKPKIFIVHTCNNTCQTFFEPIAPSNIPREVQALKKVANFKILPTWTDTVVIYSPLYNTNLYFSPFIKEFGLALCNNAFELSLHDILLQTNDQISKKPQYQGQYGVDFNYRGFNKSLFFNPGHFI